MDESGERNLREVLERMILSAEFYDSLFNSSHTPTCWKNHTACALKRIRDVLDGEDVE